MEYQCQTIWRRVNHRDLWIVLVAVIVSGLAVNLFLAARPGSKVGDVEPVVSEYKQEVESFVSNKQYDKIYERLADRDYSRYISPEVRRLCYLTRHEYGSYVSSVIDFSGINGYGFTAAVVITILWLVFLKKIDIFEPEKTRWLLVTLVVGMLAAELVIVIHDLQYLYYDFSLTGSLSDDLFYCIFGIGLREELVKLVAFFIIFKWSGQVNETVDYLIYASVSALGFAFMENLSYFNDAGLGSITTRAFSATLLHISLSAIAVSGFLIARHKNGTEPVAPYFLTSFIAAVLLHGLYDLFIFHANIPFMTVYFMLLLIAVIIIYGRLIKNALNQSQFNPGDCRTLNITRLFIYGMYLVLLSQYLITAWNYGPDAANATLVGPAVLFIVQSSTLLNSLGYITIEKGKWYSLIGMDRSGIEM